MTRRTLTIAVWTLAAGLYLWLPLWTAWHGMNSNDFKHIYLGMKALLDGSSPYSFNALHHQAALQGYRQISLNPYVYLPFTGHAMAFLAPLRLQQAAAAWFLLNHLFTAGVIWMLSALWPHRRALAAGLLTLAFAISFPLVRTLTAGQLNMALLFFICLARAQLVAGRNGRAGAILAFAALYKLMPGIFGLYFLLQRRWRAALIMTAAGAGLFVLSTLAAGLDTLLEFLPVLSQMGYGKSTWPEVFSFWDDPPNQSLNSFFTHIFAINDHTSPWYNLGQEFANRATQAVVITVVGVYCFVLSRIARRGISKETLPEQNDHAFAATLLLGLLIPSLMWDHYLVMTVLPVALLIKSSMARKYYGTVITITVCYLLICVPWPFNHPHFQKGAGILLMSMKLWPTLVLFGLSLCFAYSDRCGRQTPDESGGESRNSSTPQEQPRRV